jgi:hypothetical protein
MQAVRRNDFWILPYPEFVPLMEKKHQEVIDALNAWREHPDTARRMQIHAERMRNMPAGAQGAAR